MAAIAAVGYVAAVVASAALAQSAPAAFPLYDPLPHTGVNFSTSDRALQALFDHGEQQEAGNGQLFKKDPDFRVLEEGEQYKGAWLETQPMAGAMYAARSVRLALDNQLVFARAQRADGRLPHRLDPCAGKGKVAKPDPTCANLRPGWSLYLQGLYMVRAYSPAAAHRASGDSDSDSDSLSSETCMLQCELISLRR
jgi:hypothetical protein